MRFQGSTSWRNDSLQGGGKRNHKGRGSCWWKGDYEVYTEYIPRTKVEVVVKDDQVDLLLRKIMDTLGANEISGKIFVLEVPLTFDIKTGKKGESAI